MSRLQKKYENLMKESHRLSTTNRKASDEKFAEANEVLKEIDELKKNN